MTTQEKRALCERIQKDPTVKALRAANKELCRVMINNPNDARVVRANEQVCSAIQMLKSALKDEPEPKIGVEEVKDIIRKLQPSKPQMNLSVDEQTRTVIYYALEDVIQRIDERGEG